MNKDTTNKMTVVKNYHSLINKKAGYANFVCVGFLHLLSIFSLAFERKLKTGCGTAFNIAVPNRQGVALLINKWRTYKRSEYESHFLSWGFVQGGYTLYVY